LYVVLFIIHEKSLHILRKNDHIYNSLFMYYDTKKYIK
jgi:hypothetical protein